MSFEAEVIPLFIGGCICVTLLELVLGCFLMKGHKQARNFFIGHVLSMAVGLTFLIRTIFANWLNIEVDIASINNSVNIGLFGVFWFISVMLLLAAMDQMRK